MQHAVNLVGGRWKTVIIWYVHKKYNRFGQLLSVIDGITKKMLPQQLKELEANQVITRSVLVQKPLHIEYSLTDLGESLLPIFNLLDKWGDAQLKSVSIASLN